MIFTPRELGRHNYNSRNDIFIQDVTPELSQARGQFSILGRIDSKAMASQDLEVLLVGAETAAGQKTGRACERISGILKTAARLVYRVPSQGAAELQARTAPW